ncbi:hypothetical protein A2833_01150 [Candidatus Azambacteria bacterium RIFCSPHIGHO2_01_FULL_44_55]|uniref:Large ribosomal subunit protein bL25 n=1 Tax=Candidatus Azambacteria bacterium RIFCSPLOWO2_02_FULL_44_14 TaxID=1797306 RepID=A0A1F5C9V8_9BACT|nr:MAG: hypothetical protein A3A18_02065 [Candidatus Azambacteria bacterium RIFCSPLOWO2_01_FULL_44_84]OGD33119.1 MAG: hypothetical protein A3C78_02525 [Candidatus Azambacteria bacterium RIFCSPHIGHO2_02_FULL_45_18]OGD39637.1 MAG: hypothetical protein A3I30_04040 [Candidatus Azambacteria bacterium RIFCSPLOWO2_02_FULL_44_14]OGD40843.1 MAG: hypothetical protein A2833_01150 [Candidatus Azambacteria bacterium RIFCSPHIGHO2_01_FULL_44_55]OGD51951.1 MAG: hypothetical protein A2608_02340 [Candidatus Azam
MNNLIIKTKKREILGKKVKSLRNQGFLPAVVYGGKNENISLVLPFSDFEAILKKAGETTLVQLEIEGETKPRNVLIYDVLRDPISSRTIHVDFYQVNMDEKIIKKIPLAFTGKSAAVDDLGGVLVKAMQELEVRALPADLPHEMTVDISRIATFKDNILVRDLIAPSGVEVLENPETPVASVLPPRSDEELATLTEEVAEKVEKVKAETEEKVAERAKEAEAKEAPAA